MKTLRPVDIAVGCFLALLGLFILYASSIIRVGVARALSPRTIPSAIGFLILFCGIGLAVKSWRFRGEDPKINWPDREGKRIILAIFEALSRNDIDTWAARFLGALQREPATAE